mmetsp:Transcript_82620/g.172944  ORF Transcript_82620/g.172944 Transcript_82620/m.172944 type:complete len:415 (-) Transcript_82620:47-1291(-)
MTITMTMMTSEVEGLTLTGCDPNADSDAVGTEFVSESSTAESFDDMGLPENLLRGIYSHGFESPSEVQRRAILPALSGRDVIAQAQSGTGKTAAFLVSSLARINFEIRKCQVLILAPTRELASQIREVACSLGHWMGLRCHICVGGTARREDHKHLRAGQHMVLGTPGRVYDMIISRSLDVNYLQTLVLDEADEMLSYEFKEQIYSIFQLVDPRVQVCLFSATMDSEILAVTQKFMQDPVKLLMKSSDLSLEGIPQYAIQLDREEWKLEVLLDLYAVMAIQHCIIYCNTQKKVDWLAAEMAKRDFPVSFMHAGLTADGRQAVMQGFRAGSTRMLISTDLLARGIDVQQVSLVVNYDIPKQTENYMHRIGRSGRYGRKGTAINFVTRRDVRTLLNIEQTYGVAIEELPADIADKL